MTFVNQLPTGRRASWRSYFRATTILFCAVHIAAVAGVVYLGWSWTWAAIALGVYFVRMVFVTAGYHRYFAHRAFKTSRVFQFLLAVGAQSAAQKGVLWWASHHRYHHKHSDTATDVHSARHRGFWYAHIGWLFNPEWSDTHWNLVSDLARFPELRVLNRSAVHFLPAVVLALITLALGNLEGLVWGFFVSTVLLWHGSFSINSLAHLFGSQRYRTNDDSRNNWLLALITTGEGWHNNHHHYQSSAKQGFRWWEIDVTYYFLCALAALGLIWD
ncbi:MAG TPA: acyl-CoA desaturase, partial [Polyangiaceae bacterium]|nr:acyl-CoA desaturase [Polyangiaceae bacterium]